jgi:hypothetical protein
MIPNTIPSMIYSIIYYDYKITIPVCVGLLLGCGLSICGGFILGIRKLKLENPSYKEVENRIIDIQSHQIYQKQQQQQQMSSSSNVRVSSSSSNPFVRIIQGFTGSGNSTGYEELRDVEGEEFGRQSKEVKPRTKPTTVDAGSQVCQEIISKRERRNDLNENGHGNGKDDHSLPFIQNLFHADETSSASKLCEQDPKLSAQYTCAICLDELCLGNTNMTTTGCGHTFHLSCLLKSLNTKNLCPMCRHPLEDMRTKQQPSNVLTPLSAEQIITEEISYFPNAAHAHSMVLSRHPKRRLKELLRVFGFTLLRSVAEYVHDENLPAGWYDDGDSEESDDSNESNESNESDENEENGENSEDGEANDDEEEEDDQEDPETGFIMDTHGRR